MSEDTVPLNNTDASNTTGSHTNGTTEMSGTSMETSNTTGNTSTSQASGTVMESDLPHNGDSPTHQIRSRLPSVSSSMGSRSRRRRKELAIARVELLKKQVELAAARVTLLEEDIEDEEPDNITSREELMSKWIQSTAPTLTQEPHNQDITDAKESRHHIEINAPIQRASETHFSLVRATQARSTEAANTASCVHPVPLYSTQHGAEVPKPEESHVPGTNPSHVPARYYEGPPANGNIDYKELAAAITLASRAIHPVATTRNQELPPFSGESNDWLPFKTAYEETASLLSDQDNLSRLRRSLRGIAKDAVHSLFVGSTTTKEVMKLLAARFGRPDALVTAEMNKLRNLPRLSENPRDICVFASNVQNITATVKALNKHHYLYNAEVVRGVVEKLPSALRHRYYDYAAEEPEDQPDLITLSKFLEQTADRCGPYAPAESIGTHDRREPTVKKPVRSYDTNEQSSTSTNTMTCSICNKEGHQAPQCTKMKDIDMLARWELAKTHKLCFRCLRVRKFRHVCKTKKCDINGCTYIHHPLLHSASTTQSQAVNTTHVVDTPTDVSTIVSTQEKIRTTALLKILPIKVTGPKGTYDTYALLDDGSTCTVIEKAIAEKIGATGPPEPFFIEGVAGMKIDALQARRVRFNISGRGTASYDISGRTMESLQLSPQSVSRGVIAACLHIEDFVDQLTYEYVTPTVLLGQDNWHLLLTHEVRQGERNQPVTSLTDLG